MAQSAPTIIVRMLTSRAVGSTTLAWPGLRRQMVKPVTPRSAPRYDKLAASYLAFVKLVPLNPRPA
jgi:hypothetical protein